MKYSIVVPAYNEADKITSTLTQIISFMRDFSRDFEVVVCNDGSLDTTAKLVLDYASSNSEVRLLDLPHRGKGPTVMSGILDAKGELLYMCDADLSTPISELKKLSFWVTDQDFDIVIASREGTGAVRVNEPFYRHLMGRVFNLWVRIVALPEIKDSQCGFKLFKSAVAKDVVSRMKVYKSEGDELNQAFFGAFDVEMLFIAKKLDYKIKELPVQWNYVGNAGRALIFNTIKMTLDVLKIRINALKGAYK